MTDFVKKILHTISFWSGFCLCEMDAPAISQKLYASKNFFKTRWLKRLKKKMFIKYGLEIDTPNIGENFIMGHARNITINGNAVIGNNCVIFKNATLGSIRSGLKKGAPTLGDNVVVCCNAFVCGGIHIGDDVLIAANSFVNFDVPSHSVVIGNPGVIHHKVCATQDYIK